MSPRVSRYAPLAVAGWLLWVWATPLAAAERRVALVIGEGAYRAAPKLANPPNDARDVAQELRTLGFDVTLRVDLNQAEMTQALADFGARAASADVSLFYYGGHGLQADQQNYLVPVDAELHKAADIARSAVTLGSVVASMAKAKGPHLIFLDACRENPLKAGDSVPGLARLDAPADFLIGFATRPNAVAFDGAGRNSPFAQGLLQHLTTPGIDIVNVMTSVARDVRAATGGEQTPSNEFSLTEQVFLAGRGPADASPEATYWRLAKDDSDVQALYLKRYPNGAHAADVRELLKSATKPRDRADEEEFWKIALSSRDLRVVEIYRSHYPAGAHAREADELAASLAETQSPAKDPGLVCDRLATHPNDSTASAPGVDLATLATNAAAAIDACGKAREARPDSAHYEALLARAHFAAGHFDESVKLYRAASEAGDARAMMSLGLLMEAGQHVTKDVPGTYALYEKAAERGSADGAVNVAVALTQGKVLPKDVSRAHVLLKVAADAGSAVATFDLGKFAEDGLAGVASDALALYQRAARSGYSDGYRAAAVLLDEGRRAPRDNEAAADELLKAVAADSGRAIGELTGPVQSWAPATVSALQRRLKTAGYYAGAVDGRSGPALAPALKRWRLLGDPRGLVAHSAK